MCLLLITALYCSSSSYVAQADVDLHGQDSLRCLAETVYHEARGETEDAQIAVAHVVLTRVQRSEWPDTVCAVVKQGMHENARPVRWRCKFTWYCDGKSDAPHEAGAWNDAAMLAADVLSGRRRVPAEIHGATHYHADYVAPDWAPTFRLLAKLGQHYFYVKEKL